MRLKESLVQNIPAEARLDLDMAGWKKLQAKRQALGISRYKLAETVGVYKTVVQQWETKQDNVMPGYGQMSAYLSAINDNLNSQDAYVYLPIKYWRKEGINNGISFFLDNRTRQIKTNFEIDERLAYLLGWYLGDGCAAFTKENPNRFSFLYRWG